MKWTLSILLLIAALSDRALCATTALAYGQRIIRATEQIERIKTDEGYGEEGVGYIKQLLPINEEVETGSGTISVDNSWLHRLLDEYKSQKDKQQRVAKLDEAAGRLRALSEHLRAAEGETGEGQARQKVEEILRRSEYREKGEDKLTALIKKIRTEILNFFQGLLSRIFAAIYGAGTEAGWVFRGILILAVVITLALAVRMAMRIERGKKRGRKRTVLGEEIEEGMSAQDLAEAGLAAARAGDFRLAVRKLYISLLYEMAEQNLVELEANATNREYLESVSSHSTLTSMMRYLTDRFEYFWYGMYSPTEEDFSAYLKSYETGIASVRLLGEKAEG
jgi:hypothetical protein